MKRTSITSGQQVQYRQVVEAAAKHGITLAYDKVEADQDGWQRVIESGDELKAAIAEVIVAKTRQLSVTNEFLDEEVESNYRYLSGYHTPKPVCDQIDILRAHWPQLNPGKALAFMKEAYPKLQLPNWIEGPFALIRPGFFSDVYGEEVEEIFKALTKDRNGKFYNYAKGKFGSKYLRQTSRTVAAVNRVLEQQPDSDIIILPEQFGIRHRGRSVRRARAVFADAEFGEGTKNVSTMILTTPERLQHYDDLWIDCAGDEYAPGADGVFRSAPFFDFNGGGLGFGTYFVGDAGANYGSASAFLPQ